MGSLNIYSRGMLLWLCVVDVVSGGVCVGFGGVWDGALVNLIRRYGWVGCSLLEGRH